MAPDPKAKYGVTLITRKTPNAGITQGKLIARVGLLEYLDLSEAPQGEVTFSTPFNKAGHTRRLYPGAPPINVSGTTGMVVTVGRTNSLRGGRSWTLVIGGEKFGIRVINLRAEDVQEALKGATGITPGDYMITDDGGIYDLKDTAPPTTTFGALGTDTLAATPGQLQDPAVQASIA